MRGILRMWRRLAGVAFLTLLANGCAATSDEAYIEIPAERQFSEFEREGVVYAIDVYDPLEGFNRGVYKFNARFDQFVYLPIVKAYETVLPEIVQTGVSNFFANLSNLTTFANEVLQLKFKAAGRTSVRFVANATAGWLGFIDAAGGSGMRKTEEDFGQTLGHWGVGDGAFLVLPILGPSNARDAAGLAVDTVAFSVVDPLNASSVQTDYPPILLLNLINKRKVQSFRYYESGSPFEYDLVRMLYTKKRQPDIQD